MARNLCPLIVCFYAIRQHYFKQKAFFLCVFVKSKVVLMTLDFRALYCYPNYFQEISAIGERHFFEYVGVYLGKDIVALTEIQLRFLLCNFT